MRIGELAAQSGFSVETIRFYEAKGLIDPALRTQSNYRIYGNKHLERLRFIRHCRALDMSLEDIAALVAFDANKLDDCRHVHVMVAEHVKRSVTKSGNCSSFASTSSRSPCAVPATSTVIPAAFSRG